MNKKFIFTNENGDPYPEWEQKKLGDFLSKYTDTTIQVEDEKSYSQLTVSKNTGVSKRGDILGAQIGRKRQFVVDTNKYPNTLTFTRQTVMDGGIGFISHELNGFIATENMPLLSLDTSKCKKEYLNQYIGSDSYYEKVIFPIKPTGSAQIALHEKDWLAQVIPFPSLPEQQKIAEFFSALDERIALTADKVKLLKEQKQGYLEKVFSRELVFTDDNGDTYGDWEQSKVEEIFDVTRGQVIAKPSLSPVQTDETPYPVYSSQTSNKGILGWSNSYDFEGNYLTWTTDGAHAGRVFSRTGKFRCTNVCGILVEKEETIGFANLALSELLNSAASKYVMRGLGNPKLMNDVMRKVPISVPSLPEQKKIAEFFSVLDEQIELTENKLTLLKEQKKGYLQGIFG